MRILIIGQHTNNFGDEGAGLAAVQKMMQKKDISSIDILYHGGG